MKKTFLFLIIFIFLHSIFYGQVNTESFRISNDSTGLSIISDIELTLMAGNTDFQYFGNNTRINYGWTVDDYTFLILNGGFGRNNGQTFFSQGLAHLRNVNILSKNIHLEEYLQYDNNKSLLLMDRYLAGAGLRFKILNGEKIISRIGTALFFEYEENDLSPAAQHETETRTIRFNSYFTFTVKLKEDMTLLSVTYIQPDIQNLEDIRILSNNALQVKLSESIILTTKIDARYDSYPADSIREFDIFSKIGLGVMF